MKLLLDTHAFLWALMEPVRLSDAARSALLDSGNQVYVSAVSFWEIALKHAQGKLELSGLVPADLPRIAEMEMGLILLPLACGTAAEMGSVSRLHGDPFDRMLIHQSIAEEFYLVSADSSFAAYEAHGLKLCW